MMSPIGDASQNKKPTNALRYRDFIWWARTGSNRGPADYELGSLLFLRLSGVCQSSRNRCYCAIFAMTRVTGVSFDKHVFQTSC